MRFAVSALLTVISGVVTIGRAAAYTNVGMHLVQPIDNAFYALDVSDAKDDPKSPRLYISCVDKCKRSVSYEDDINGFLLMGAFGMADRFVTLWGAGSAQWVIIYRVSDGVVTKVLEQPSRTLPDFESTPDGRGVIVLHNDTPGMYINKELYGQPPGLSRKDRERIRKETTSLWVWTGTTYVPYHGQVLAGWEVIK